MNRAIIAQYKKVSSDISLKPMMPKLRVNPANILEWNMLLLINDVEYVVRCAIPQNYPAAAPEFIMLSECVKYNVGEKICLGDDAARCVGITEFIVLLAAKIATEPPKRECGAATIAALMYLFE